MTPFRQIDVADRFTVFPYIYYGAEPIYDIPFANLYDWVVWYETSWAIGGTQTLVIHFRSPRRDHPVYLCPFCRDDNSWTITIKELMGIPEQEAYPLVLMGVAPDCKERLERLFPDEFVRIQGDDYIDYVYLREKLARLNGRKLQLKCNHISCFEASYPDYRYLPVTTDDLKHVAHSADEWLAHAEATGDPDPSLHIERRVIQRFPGNYEALEIRGGMIKIEGRIVAFTLGSPITEDTFDVHIERVHTDIDGAYMIINREFVRSIPEQCTYVSGEEDLGLPDLRQAKESCHPEVRLIRHTYIRRRPDWAGELES